MKASDVVGGYSVDGEAKFCVACALPEELKHNPITRKDAAKVDVRCDDCGSKLAEGSAS